MPTDFSRTRFDAIRESELDMRCMVRDMAERRRIRVGLERIQRRKRRGHEVDEVRLARLLTQSRRFSNAILERWSRLHRRMNREQARQAMVANIFSERGKASGDSAHP